jgi:hypothetical protein
VAKLSLPSYSFIVPVSHIHFYACSRTFNIFAIRFLVLAKTVLTSRETVDGDGTWYSGRPVFINDRNPRSLTILNGRAFSATQRTISALRLINIISRVRQRNEGLSLRFGVGPMRVCHPPFSCDFKCSSDGAVSSKGLHNAFSCLSGIFNSPSCFDGLFPPA